MCLNCLLIHLTHPSTALIKRSVAAPWRMHCKACSLALGWTYTQESSMDSKFRSRKWLLTITVQLFTCGALVAGLLGGDEFVQVTMTNVGAYSFANAATAYMSR